MVPKGSVWNCVPLSSCFRRCPSTSLFPAQPRKKPATRQHALSFDSFSFSNTFPKWNIFTFQMKGFAYIYIVLHHIPPTPTPNASYLAISSRHTGREDFFLRRNLQLPKAKTLPEHRLCITSLRSENESFKSHWSLCSGYGRNGGLLCREAWGLW